MAVSGDARGKKLSGDELKVAVRTFCLAEFKKRLGKPWTESFERTLSYKPEHPVQRRAAGERKARAVYERLRKAMQEAEAFAKSQSEGGRTAIFLGWWVPQFISPLLQHASMGAEPKDFGENLDDPRALLAKALDDYDMFGLPPAVGGGSSFLDAREHAIVSLLVGNWPAKKMRAATVAEIVELETATMRYHVKTHGQADHAPEMGITAKRGPEHRRERRAPGLAASPRKSAASATKTRKHEK